MPGCLKVVLRKGMNMHIQEAASSHYNLQSGEIQRLHPLLSDGDLTSYKSMPKKEKVVSFNWRATGFMAVQSGHLQPIVSDTITPGRNKWRSLFTVKKNLVLQLVSASAPLTVQIRIVMRPGEDKEHVFILKEEIMRGEDMWG